MRSQKCFAEDYKSVGGITAGHEPEGFEVPCRPHGGEGKAHLGQCDPDLRSRQLDQLVDRGDVTRLLTQVQVAGELATGTAQVYRCVGHAYCAGHAGKTGEDIGGWQHCPV